MFEIASRKKYRFQYRGTITTEDLWDLGIEDLDSIFKALNSQKKTTEEESLLETKTAADADLEKKIEIVKHIFSYKVAESEAKKNAADKRLRKKRLLQILAEKQDETLQGKSVEEIQKMIEELD